MWCSLPDTIKNCWIEAGRTINTYEEFAKSIPNKVSIIFYILVIFFYILCLYNNYFILAY